MFKKTISILLAIVLSASLMACGGAKSEETGAAESAVNGGTGAAQAAVADEEDSAAVPEDASADDSAAAAAEDVDIPETPYTRDDGGITMDVFAMDTYMNLLAYGDRAEEAVLAAAAEIHKIDDMLSTGNPDSEISKLNAAGKGDVSDVVVKLVSESQALYKDTGGLFDIAIYPIMKLWGFPTQQYKIPEKAEIDAALKIADPSSIVIGGPAAPAAAAEGATTAAAEAAAAPSEEKAAEEKAADEKATEEKAADEKAAEAEKTVEATAEGAANTEKQAEAEIEKAASDEEKPADSEAEKAAAQADAGADAAAGAAAGATGAPEVAAAEAPKTQVSFGVAGMEIDLGGIAKGYTSSRVMEIFKEYGIEHGLVSLGGNVQALGGKESGDPWRVAIQNPESELDYLGILEIKDKCVITSGGYERFFEKDGVRYHHIIDPRTGYPADSGIISSTIISSDGTLADGLSTSLFIMGLDEAKKYWQANSDKFDFILEDSSGKLYVSEGAANLLTTEMDLEVVEK